MSDTLGYLHGDIGITITGEAAHAHSELVLPTGHGIEVVGWHEEHPDGSHMGSSVFLDGQPIWQKTKHRITGWEREHGFIPGPPAYLAEVGGLRILVLICKEILHPEDWWDQVPADLAVHQVGFPMFDRHQANGWRALHRALALHIGGPVLVQVHGEVDDPDTRISGVVGF